ncbi:hypothetical protein [Ktedonospora formicarum]|uniref:Uncharacterized protein n=1 Tax=Ktedonospora formicarum TaxID=2778364 RepID=A0A8J3MXC3_9CHLR|nr:hypothetical protein [Ktedonospora formicarum]GHO48410.1 hypothetical protein KSX_65730 [Ktedonospora formicarum]
MQFINIDALKDGLSKSADIAELSDAELEKVSGRGGNPGATCEPVTEEDWSCDRNYRGVWVSTSACDIWGRDGLTFFRW